jgi:hypothetical protein
MPDYKKMTVESLRELARKVLGPGQSKKTKAELVAALESAGGKGGGAARATGAPARPAGAAPAGKAAKAAGAAKSLAKGVAKGAARKAGEAAREGAKAVARAGKAAAGAGKLAASAAREGAKGARARRPGKVAAAVAAVTGAAAGAAAGVAAARQAAKAARSRRDPSAGPDPDGFFVARVRGEDAVREAPHPMAEAAGEGWLEAEEAVGAVVYDEQLGELPWGYGDDAFVALARDPRTLFLYWDWAQPTLARAFEGLDHPRTQLWVFARADGGWERVRITEFALESRGFYVHDLAPGRTYRAEIHVVDRAGRERLLATSSNECGLPPVGPSPVVDDRFVRLPWDVPLGRLLGPGHAGAPFPEDARALLARLSDWSRFSSPTWGGSAGGMGGRPFSPVSSPSSPFGGGAR